MSAVLLREAVGTMFSAGWTATPIAWPNRPFEPPDGAWVRVTFLDGQTFQAEIGGSVNQDRKTGFVVVGVFAELEKGDKPALELAEQVAQLFRDNKYLTLTGNVGRVLFRRPNVQNIGPDGRGVQDSSNYQVNVTVPYVLDFVS